MSDQTRDARHIALAEIGGDGQARIAAGHGRRTEPLRLDKQAEDELRALGYIQ